MNEFHAADYTRAHLLDALVSTGLKAISNYVTHLAQPPLDDAFASPKWTRPN